MKMTLTIKSIKNNQAILENDDGGIISWPKNKLPKNSKENDILTLILTKGEEKDEKLAKNIINELLSN